MRLFLAIELERPAKRSLLDLISGLSEFRRSVRWVSEQQMHLTLKFLGEVGDEDVGGICEACEGVAAGCEPFEFVLDSVGCFPPEGRVRVIWGGCSQMPPALSACAGRCEDALSELGIAREGRPFSAHMTVGRVRHDDTRGRLRRAVGAISVNRARQHVDSMTLFESVLSPGGARYSTVGRYPFGGPA